MSDHINAKLLEVLACPRCLGRLQYDKDNQRFICHYEYIAYPIENGVPVLLIERAKPLPLD